MNVDVFQHVPFEGLGSMRGWFREQGAEVHFTRFFEQPEWPPPDHDLLVVMGGPMSVNDEATYPWLAAEKAAIAERLQRGLPTLGICLGAQLIANAAGARVFDNGHKEIGWFPIEGTGVCPVFEQERTYPVFHWHGETFELPAGASLLASSQACAHQGFVLGRALALQFHVETTRESALALIEHSGDELTEGRYVQRRTELEAVPEASYTELETLMRRTLEWVTG